MKRALLLLTVALLACGALPALATGHGIPDHPSKLKFGKLKFDVPDGNRYRHVLSNGVVVYVVEDHTLPLVNVQALVRVGEFLEPPEKAGLAGLTGTMMREGGAGDLDADAFDQRADFLAASISSWIGSTRGGASLNCITPVLDQSLDLFFDMMRYPRFQEDRFEIEKGNLIEAMKQRNDDADDILRREFSWLIYGRDHYSTRYSTKATIDAISRDDLVDFHRKYWQPKNMMLAISGDVKTDEILAALEKRFAGWASDGPDVPWPPAPPKHEPVPGLYHVEKDIPQGKVRIGHLGTTWKDPNQFALRVMNEILGGGGFTSRITKRVRSDEGLAYHAASYFGIGTWWPGTFAIVYQSKNPTVALAGKIALEEVERIRREKVSDEELTTAKNSMIETFPRRFESAARRASLFAEDEFIGRPHGYWKTWRENVKKVDAKKVLEVAREYLHPDKVVFLVVGKWSEIEKGDPEGRASMKDFFGGRVTHLPLRDPLTLEPLPSGQQEAPAAN